MRDGKDTYSIPVNRTEGFADWRAKDRGQGTARSTSPQFTVPQHRQPCAGRDVAQDAALLTPATPLCPKSASAPLGSGRPRTAPRRAELRARGVCHGGGGGFGGREWCLSSCVSQCRDGGKEWLPVKWPARLCSTSLANGECRYFLFQFSSCNVNTAFFELDLKLLARTWTSLWI